MQNIQNVRIVQATTVGAVAGTFDIGPPATITMSNNGQLTVDGYSAVIGDDILVKDETDKTHNGPYEVTTVGDELTQAVLTYDGIGGLQIASGLIVVANGSVNQNAGWITLASNGLVTGVDEVVYTKLFPHKK